MNQYQIRPMTKNDLASLTPIQPTGWRNLEQVFGMFIKVPTCKPFVADVHGHVVATGLATVNGSVGWIGMIIVHPEFRSRGIGTQMTSTVMEYLRQKGCTTLMLTATQMGRPVYEKLGFRVQTENHFYRGAGMGGFEQGHNVRSISINDLSLCLRLDENVVGEDRAELFSNSFESGWMVVGTHQNTIRGFCARTTLGSPAVAMDSETIPLLLDIKRTAVGRRPMDVVVPSENAVARKYLMQHGFEEIAVSPRMILGPEIQWAPSLVVDRFMGAMG